MVKSKLKKKGRNIVRNIELPGFTVIEQLPRGASGLIYRVRDFGGRYYVLKLFCPVALATGPDENGMLCLKPDQRQSAERLYSLFRREALVSQELYAEYGGATNSCYFFRGDFVELCPPSDERVGAYILYDTSAGRTLSALLNERRPHLDENGALLCAEWTRRLIEALRQMHGHLGEDGQPAPYLHLDVKCSNIYATDMAPGSDEAMRVFKMLDLGSAMPCGGSNRDKALRRSLGKSLSATEGYAAPELLSAIQTGSYADLTERTDVYSVAAVLFTMLMGRPYDFDDLELHSPCVLALPMAARRQLKDILSSCLESRERMSLNELYDALADLTDTIRRRGLSRAVLFDGAAAFARDLREKPDERLLAGIKVNGESAGNFADVMERNLPRVCLVGSGMMGKTFSMLHCVCRLTARFEPDRPVPLYVPLRAMKNRPGKTPLSDYIVSRYGGEAGEDRAFALRQSLRQGGFLLLADGLNELSGDESLGPVLSELREFMELGVRVAVSGQSDPRQSLLAGLDMALCTLEPLEEERIGGYLAAMELPDPDRDLMKTLSFPMLLKMYALSERGVIEGDYLSNKQLRFIPGARQPAEIIHNYREYCLSKFLGTEDFEPACLLLRLFLPYLAYNMCAVETVISLKHVGLNGELDYFFHDLERPGLLGEAMSYGLPHFLPPDKWDEIEDYDRDITRIFTAVMGMNGALDLTEEDFRRMCGEDALEMELDEIKAQLLYTDTARMLWDMRLSRRRAKNCIDLLRRSGLLDCGEDEFSFAHEELKFAFCAEYVMRFCTAGPARLEEMLGRFRLNDRTAFYAAQLGRPETALETLRGRFEDLDYGIVRLFDPEGMLLSTAPLFTAEGIFNLVLLEVIRSFICKMGWTGRVETAIEEFGRERLNAILVTAFLDEDEDECEFDFKTDDGEPPLPIPLPSELAQIGKELSEQFTALFGGEPEDEPEDEYEDEDEEDDLYVLTEDDRRLAAELRQEIENIQNLTEDPELLYLSPLMRMKYGKLMITADGNVSSPIPPQGFVEMMRLTRGGPALAAANLVRILDRAHRLPGADLHELDLSAANLADCDLRGCNLRGARLRMSNLRGFLRPEKQLREGKTVYVPRPMTQVRHMIYSDNGQFLYVLTPHHFRGFDMENGSCILHWEITESEGTWFWLNEKNDTICLARRDGYVDWLDAYTGKQTASFRAALEDGEGEIELWRIADMPDGLYVEDRSQESSRVACITFDRKNKAHYSPWKAHTRINQPDRQSRLRGADYRVLPIPFGYYLYFGSEEEFSRRAAAGRPLGSFIRIGEPFVKRLSCAVAPARDRIAVCTGENIVEYHLRTGEKLNCISGTGTAQLQDADLRGVFPAMSEEQLRYLAALGAVTD